MSPIPADHRGIETGFTVQLRTLLAPGILGLHRQPRSGA